MNMTQTMQAMSNPQGMMMQYMIKGMIAENPQVWQQCQEKFSNKNHRQQVSELRALYKSKGMDLDSTAKQWGISL